MKQRDPVRRDVERHGHAAAHADSCRPKREAHRLGTSARTQRRWATEGPPQLRQLSLYLDGHPAPHRILAHVRAMAELDIRDTPTADLIAEYRDLLLKECEVEAKDRRTVLARDAWLDVAAASERNAAVDVRKAAIVREFAARRIRHEEVLDA